MRYNPFVPNGIAFPGMFTGRLDEIETIEHSLFQTKNENPQHVLISGERGIGKSSLLFYADLIARGDIEVEKANFNFLSVSTDLAGVTSQGGIIEQIGRELRSKLKSYDKLRAFAHRHESIGDSHSAEGLIH
ncbi:ATP-binding protein [Psychromarinibacter sp. C21-152]|uniref:ATP-binding protein n=1 Tax=Psychromarinibacter sediminicola TaxID=3033385 RepID=A0AAE3NTM9_9RHOB|nr:ATP-binding protein [Psychromarinibacter sediminicola]MDF0601801.1 ATP-binding protein [Psychromarinibacter sediminicola]